MKTLSKLGILLALGVSLSLASCTGEYYVTDEPADVYYNPGAPPYAGAVWIDGDWLWNGGHYIHSGGHWERPRAGHMWVKGSWHHGRRGYAWHRGHWK